MGAIDLWKDGLDLSSSWRDPAEWLLLFLSREPLAIEEPAWLDPLRIQKGLFLLSQRGPVRGVYEFEPHNWGPFSRDIYSDLDDLVGFGAVEKRPVPGRSWFLYRTTAKGERRAAQFAADLDRADVQWLADTRTYVTSRPFVRLLREIYREYPQFATRTKLR